MTLPVLKVEIGFGYTAVDVITWTDVTAYVRGFSSNRGRSTELDSTQTGACTILLNNRTRRFDPEYAAGPYYVNLVNNVPVRVTCTHTAVTYNLFYGYVDGWPQTYEPIGDSTVALSCSDAFKLFNRWPLPESVYDYTVAQDAPKVRLRLGDQGEIAVDSSGNGYDGRYGGGAEQGQPGLYDGATDTAVTFNGEAGSGISETNPASFISAVPIAAEAWFELTDARPGFFVAQSYDSSGYWWMGFGSDGSIYGGSDFPTLEQVYLLLPAFTLTTTAINVGRHYIAWKRTATVHELYLDGVKVVSATYVPTAPPAGRPMISVAWSPMVQPYAVAATLDEVAVYDVDLSAAQIAAHYAAGVNPWYGDNTGTRLGRVLDVIGWPAGLRTIDTGETILDVATLARRPVLDYIQQVAETEQGRLFMGPDGKVVFHQRNHDLALTSQATFTDDGTNVDYLTSGLRFSKDERFTFNEVTAQREGGTPVTVGTGDPITVSKSISGLLVQTDAEVRNIAESFLWRYKTPVSRVDGWTVRPEKRAAKWPTVLGLEIGERVTLQRTPMKLGAQISKDFVIESVAWEFRPGDVAVSYTGSPVDPTSYFVVGTSQAGGTDVIR